MMVAMQESLVRKLREHARWTPEALAHALGSPFETVIDWAAVPSATGTYDAGSG